MLQYQRKLHCQHLTTVGKPFNRKNYAFAVPKGTAFLETITMSILRLQESGELDKIKQKWFEGETTCSGENNTSPLSPQLFKTGIVFSSQNQTQGSRIFSRGSDFQKKIENYVRQIKKKKTGQERPFLALFGKY